MATLRGKKRKPVTPLRTRKVDDPSISDLGRYLDRRDALLSKPRIGEKNIPVIIELVRREINATRDIKLLERARILLDQAPSKTKRSIEFYDLTPRARSKGTLSSIIEGLDRYIQILKSDSSGFSSSIPYIAPSSAEYARTIDKFVGRVTSSRLEKSPVASEEPSQLPLMSRILGHNYTGKGTPLRANLYADEVKLPVSYLDLLSLRHDLQYGLSQSDKDIQAADTELIQGMNDAAQNNALGSFGETLKGVLSGGAMSLKAIKDSIIGQVGTRLDYQAQRASMTGDEVRFYEQLLSYLDANQGRWASEEFRTGDLDTYIKSNRSKSPEQSGDEPSSGTDSDMNDSDDEQGNTANFNVIDKFRLFHDEVHDLQQQKRDLLLQLYTAHESLLDMAVNTSPIGFSYDEFRGHNSNAIKAITDVAETEAALKEIVSIYQAIQNEDAFKTEDAESLMTQIDAHRLSLDNLQSLVDTIALAVGGTEEDGHILTEREAYRMKMRVQNLHEKLITLINEHPSLYENHADVIGRASEATLRELDTERRVITNRISQLQSIRAKSSDERQELFELTKRLASIDLRSDETRDALSKLQGTAGRHGTHADHYEGHGRFEGGTHETRDDLGRYVVQRRRHGQGHPRFGQIGSETDSDEDEMDTNERQTQSDAMFFRAEHMLENFEQGVDGTSASLNDVLTQQRSLEWIQDEKKKFNQFRDSEWWGEHGPLNQINKKERLIRSDTARKHGILPRSSRVEDPGHFISIPVSFQGKIEIKPNEPPKVFYGNEKSTNKASTEHEIPVNQPLESTELINRAIQPADTGGKLPLRVETQRENVELPKDYYWSEKREKRQRVNYIPSFLYRSNKGL